MVVEHTREDGMDAGIVRNVVVQHEVVVHGCMLSTGVHVTWILSTHT